MSPSHAADRPGAGMLSSLARLFQGYMSGPEPAPTNPQVDEMRARAAATRPYSYMRGPEPSPGLAKPFYEGGGLAGLFGMQPADERIVEAQQRATALREAGDHQGALMAQLDNPMAGAIGPADMGGISGLFAAIFAGPRARTANKAALAQAKRMARSGASPDDIWRDTGWFQGVDGQWRFEIPDKAARLHTDRMSGSGGAHYSEDVFAHPELYQAYPAAKRGTAITPIEGGGGTFFELGGGRGLVEVGRSADSTVPLHEFQHYSQMREGFARGSHPRNIPSNPDLQGAMAAERAPLLRMFEEASLDSSAMRAEVDKLAAQNLYRRLAGEVEARAVEARAHLSPEQRAARPPWSDYDVPADQQILTWR